MKHKLISPLFLYLIAILGVFIIFFFVPSRILLPNVPLGFIVFLLAIFYWLYFSLGAIHIHKRAHANLENIDSVVTSGVYSLVRHPMYSSNIVLVWALFIIFPDLRVLLSVVWVSVAMIIWIELEERELAQKFGDEHKTYRSQVPKLIPRIRKK
jgi:protein-S-isoprenylcysteine O-methyltransferase Ste14